MIVQAVCSDFVTLVSPQPPCPPLRRAEAESSHKVVSASELDLTDVD